MAWLWLHSLLIICTLLYYAWRLLRRLVGRRRRFEMGGKTILVTGASSGLGREIACQLHAMGAKLVLTARSVDKLADLCAELRRARPDHPAPVYRYLDLANPTAVVHLASLTPAGRFDVIINNAGMSVRAPCEATSLQVHKRIMEVNYFGQIAVTQALLPLMASDGCVVVIGSVQSRVALPHRAAYAASKHALQAYFDSLRAETAATGLRILFVSPGYIRTDLSIHSVTGDGRQYGRVDPKTAAGMPVESAAAATIAALRRGEQELVLAPLQPRIAIALRYLFPELFFRIMARLAVSGADEKVQ